MKGYLFITALCLLLAGCGGRFYVPTPSFDADAMAVDAQTAYSQGKIGQGIDLLRMSLNYNRGTDRLRSVAQNLNDLGVLTMAAGDYAQAQGYLDEASMLYERLGDKQGAVSAKLNLVSLRIRQGKVASVVEELTPVLEEAQKANAPAIEASVHNEIGRALARDKQYGEAISHFEKALALHHRSNSPQGESTSLHNLADVYLSVGKADKSKELLDKAIAIDKEKQMWSSLGDDLFLQGNALQASGGKTGALFVYERAFYVFRYTSSPLKMDAARDAIRKLGGIAPPDEIAGKVSSNRKGQGM